MDFIYLTGGVAVVGIFVLYAVAFGGSEHDRRAHLRRRACSSSRSTWSRPCCVPTNSKARRQGITRMNVARLGRDRRDHRCHARPGLAAGRLYGARLAGRADLARPGADAGRGRPLLGLRRRSERRARAGSPTPCRMLAFSAASFVVLYLILRFQDLLPFNPQGFEGMAPDLAFNTAISFVTNTNWQFYSARAALSAFSQMAGLTVQNFLSAAAGIAVAAAVARAFAANRGEGLGNFWVDLTRISLYILLPLSIVDRLCLRRRWASPRPSPATSTPRPSKAPSRRSRSTRSPARRRSSSSAPTAAASSTPTRPTRSRTPTPITNLIEEIEHEHAGLRLRRRLRHRRPGAQGGARPGRGHGDLRPRRGVRRLLGRDPAGAGPARRRTPTHAGQHGGQGGALRRAVHGGVGRLHHRRLRRRRQRHARQLHAARRRHGHVHDPARRRCCPAASAPASTAWSSWP